MKGERRSSRTLERLREERQRTKVEDPGKKGSIKPRESEPDRIPGDDRGEPDANKWNSGDD